MALKKTNAIRELEKHNISHEIFTYTVDENNLDAVSVAIKIGADIAHVFKTLALLNEKKELIIACIPGSDELDLKKLAKLSNSKKIEMLNVKDLMTNTGYIRGGCSPIAIKKKHLSFIDNSALEKEYIIISGGQRGIQIKISPLDLIKYLNMKSGNIIID